MDEVCFVSIRGIPLLRDHGEQRHAFPFFRAARRGRSCRSASRRTIAFRDEAKWTPRRAQVSSWIMNVTMEAIASKLWTRRQDGSCTHATLHGTSRENRLFPRPPTVGSGVPHSSSGAETPDYVYIQPTPAAIATPAAAPVPAAASHPRRYQPPQHQFPIGLFGNWGTRRTCVCLVAREANRARRGTPTTAWV